MRIIVACVRSCVLGCPYSGFVAPDAVAFVARTLVDMGCYEVGI